MVQSRLGLMPSEVMNVESLLLNTLKDILILPSSFLSVMTLACLLLTHLHQQTTVLYLSIAFGVSTLVCTFILIHNEGVHVVYRTKISFATAIGNPRGDENPFLLSMGVLWFRVHQYWAKQLYAAYKEGNRPEEFGEDEWIFNRARQFTIATYQHVVLNDWLPQFLPRRLSNGIPPYEANPGYSSYFNRTGYNPSINPQVAHIFQSAAMRFGHTVVTPGIWRRQLE